MKYKILKRTDAARTMRAKYRWKPDRLKELLSIKPLKLGRVQVALRMMRVAAPS